MDHYWTLKFLFWIELFSFRKIRLQIGFGSLVSTNVRSLRLSSISYFCLIKFKVLSARRLVIRLTKSKLTRTWFGFISMSNKLFKMFLVFNLGSCVIYCTSDLSSNMYGNIWKIWLLHLLSDISNGDIKMLFVFRQNPIITLNNLGVILIAHM